MSNIAIAASLLSIAVSTSFGVHSHVDISDKHIAWDSTPIAPCVAATEPLTSAGDAADDAAVWVNPSDPAQSLIIGTNKQAGLEVYTLAGKRVQSLPDGRMNNVDVIPGIQTAQGPLDLVISSNRTTNTVSIYRVDPAARRLVSMPSISTDLNDVYGICGYIDPKSSKPRIVINDKTGQVRIFELSSLNSDSFQHRLVRSFAVGTQVEGVVADTVHGWLFVGEEAVGVWKYPLDDASETPRELLDIVKGRLGGNLARDVEGITLYTLSDGEGYIIVSCQGEDRYAVYDRVSHKYLGSFRLSMSGRDDDRAKRITHTDGITALSTPLGSTFPGGIFVAQDDNDSIGQNFAIASWSDIARQFTPQLRTTASTK